MGRRLWYRDSYGRWHEDRHAEVRSSMPARWALMALVVLAVFVVIASMIHLAEQPLTLNPPATLRNHGSWRACRR